MPFDSQGNFSRIHNWEEDRINDIDIASDRHDEEDDNFTAGLNECMLRDGRCTMNGNLNMGNYQIKNVASATASSDAVNYKQLTDATSDIKSLFNELIPIGTITPSVKTANYGNWLLCNGQAVSRTTYADLFALIGVNFGAGDGTTTFNVPDYRGKFLRGLGGDAAEDIYTTQAEGLPNITGSFGIDNTHTSSSGAFYYGTPRQTSLSSSSSNGYTEYFDASRSNAIYGASNHVTPVNQAVNWFIKAKGE